MDPISVSRTNPIPLVTIPNIDLAKTRQEKIEKIAKAAILAPILDAKTFAASEADQKITLQLTNADKKQRLLEAMFNKNLELIQNFCKSDGAEYKEVLADMRWLPNHLYQSLTKNDVNQRYELTPSDIDESRKSFFKYYAEVSITDSKYIDIIVFLDNLKNENPSEENKALLASIFNESLIKQITDRLKFSTDEALNKMTYNPFELEYELLNQELMTDSQTTATSAGREALPRMHLSGDTSSVTEAQVSNAAQAALLNPQIDTKHSPPSLMTGTTDPAEKDTKPISNIAHEMFTSQFGTDGSYTLRFNNFIKKCDMHLHQKPVADVVESSDELLKNEARQLEQAALEMIKKLAPLTSKTVPLISSLKQRIDNQVESLKKQIVHLRLLQKGVPSGFDDIVDQYNKGSAQDFARKYVAHMNSTPKTVWIKGSEVTSVKPSFWQFGWTEAQIPSEVLWFHPGTRKYVYSSTKPDSLTGEDWQEVSRQEEDRLVANLVLSDQTYADYQLLGHLQEAISSRLHSKLPLSSALRDSLRLGCTKLQKQCDLYEFNKPISESDALRVDENGQYNYLEKDMHKFETRDPIALKKLSILATIRLPDNLQDYDINAIKPFTERLSKSPYFPQNEDKEVLARAKKNIQHQILNQYQKLHQALAKNVDLSSITAELKSLWHQHEKLNQLDKVLESSETFNPTEGLMNHLRKRKDGLEDELRHRLQQFKIPSENVSQLNKKLDNALQIVRKKSFQIKEVYTEAELMEIRNILAQAKRVNDKEISKKMANLFAHTGEHVLRWMIKQDENALINALKLELAKHEAPSTKESFDTQFENALKIMQDNPDKNFWNNIQIDAFKNVLKNGFLELDLINKKLSAVDARAQQLKKADIELKIQFLSHHIGFAVLEGPNQLASHQQDELEKSLEAFVEQTPDTQFSTVQDILDNEKNQLQGDTPVNVMLQAETFIDQFETQRKSKEFMDEEMINHGVLILKKLSRVHKSLLDNPPEGINPEYAKKLKGIRPARSLNSASHNQVILQYIEKLQTQILSVEPTKIYTKLLTEALLKQPALITRDSDSDTE